MGHIISSTFEFNFGGPQRLQNNNLQLVQTMMCSNLSKRGFCVFFLILLGVFFTNYITRKWSDSQKQKSQFHNGMNSFLVDFFVHTL